MKAAVVMCLALGAVALTSAGPVHAQVSIQAPGVSINPGPQPYWREHREGDWRDRREFHDPENRRAEWQRDHCVRDWGGHVFCR
jgi:hypothetical protein